MLLFLRSCDGASRGDSRPFASSLDALGHVLLQRAGQMLREAVGRKPKVLGAELTEETCIAVGAEAEKLKTAEPGGEAAPERPRHRRLVLNTTPAMSYIVAQVLERLKGVQGMSVRVEVTAQEGLPPAKEEEIRELLKKFGITPIFE